METKPMHTNYLKEWGNSTTLEEMGAAYNPKTQVNEYKGTPLSDLPQYLAASDHTGTSTNNKVDSDDDQTSDV